jgi:hypothetical protein
MYRKHFGEAQMGVQKVLEPKRRFEFNFIGLDQKPSFVGSILLFIFSSTKG